MVHFSFTKITSLFLKQFFIIVNYKYNINVINIESVNFLYKLLIDVENRYTTSIITIINSV